MPFLSTEVKKGFEKYKYNSKDTSPLANYVMHPFWNWAVQFLPMWVAPNLMTLAGFLCTVANFLLLVYFDPNFTASSIDHTNSAPISSGIWAVCAILMAFSHHLDGMDGKQARRTGTSGPIGELFDHGCDSWATLFFTVCLYSVFGRGNYGVSPGEVFSLLWIIMSCFILSHWEKYITGVLYLPWSYDLSQLGMTAVYLITACFGSNFWQTTIPGTSYAWARLFVAGVHVGFWCLSLPATFYNVIQSYFDRSGKMLSLTDAMRPLVAPGLLLLFSLVWAIFSPTDILDTYPRLYMLFVGTVFSNIACHLIIAQMSNTQSDLLNPLGIYYCFVSGTVVAFRVYLAEYELQILAFSCILSVISHVLYAALTVNEMLDHFSLRAFVITPKKAPAVNAHVNEKPSDTE